MSAMPRDLEGSPDRLRVLTFNIWNRSGPWERRLGVIRRGIERLQPDLVALQEVLRLDGETPEATRDAADEILEDLRELGYHKVYAPATQIAGPLWLGNAVLSKFPIVTSEVMQLPADEHDETRSLLYALVEAPFGRVPFFVTHFSWQLHHGLLRQKQVAFVADRIAERTPPGDRSLFPPILAGDFNAEPASDEIRFLSGYTALDGKCVYFADCFQVAGTGPGATFVPSRNDYAAETHEPDRRIDYVFVRGPDRWVRGKPLVARVVMDEPEDGVWASDHFGVYVELSVDARAAKRPAIK